MQEAPTRVHFTVVGERGGIVVFYQWGVSSCVLQGLWELWMGLELSACPSVTSPLYWEKTLGRQGGADGIMKCTTIDSETYIKAPTLHITMSNPPITVRNNETEHNRLHSECLSELWGHTVSVSKVAEASHSADLRDFRLFHECSS